MTQLQMQTGSAAIPEADHQIPPTPQEEIDAAIDVLSSHAKEWLELSLGERITLLEQLLETTYAVSERWARESSRQKGIPAGDPAEGEEWLGGPVVVLRNLRLLIRSLRDVQAKGKPQLPAKPSVRPDGQVVAPVFPTDNWDKVLFTGFEAEVWMEPSVTPSTLEDTMAVFYANPQRDERFAEPKVGLVLGAGNVSSIGPMDALYKLFVEGEVVLLKMNPVNEGLGPIFDEAFAELVRRGFFRVVYGGAAEGDYCCRHRKVHSIHITGSDKTHDAIVWGLGDEGEQRKKRGEPRNDKPITSELGNVSPIIVVPGPWSQKDLDFHGVNLASSLTNNAGFNCNATRVIVTHAGWSQRQGLIDSVKAAFAAAPPRAPYYPGAEDRHARFVAEHPDAHQFGPRGSGRVPWTLITDLDASDEDELCFSTEAWCGVTSEVPLGGADVVEYIEKAVAFANDRCWGTLSCSILVHPKSLKDPRVAKAVDEAIATLRFGTVVVNHWAALGYAFVSTTWGAYPGHPMTDIRSGRGVVHNTYLFDRPQKSVIRGPFRVSPRPPWFLDHKTVAEIGPKLARFYYEPGLTKIPSLLFSAIRG